MPDRINVDLEDAAFFLNWLSKYSGTKFDRMRRGRLQIGHGEIKMNLLWLPIRPLGGHERSDTLKGQLQWQSGEVNFAPRRVGRVNIATEQVPIESRQSRRVWTIKDDGPQLDRF
jgi:hypothetical protein